MEVAYYKIIASSGMYVWVIYLMAWRIYASLLLFRFMYASRSAAILCDIQKMMMKLKRRVKNCVYVAVYVRIFSMFVLSKWHGRMVVLCGRSFKSSPWCMCKGKKGGDERSFSYICINDTRYYIMM